MKITLTHLKKRWSKNHLKDIKRIKRLVIGSDKVFNCSDLITTFVDAVWSNDYDVSVKKRDSNKRFKHIFISEMCKTAAEEYKTVCDLLGIEKILLVSVDDKEFYNKSKELLKPLNLNIDIADF